MKIMIESKPYVITKILKPTKAQIFCKFKEGDIIDFSVNLYEAGRYRYAKDVETYNMTQKLGVYKSFNQLVNILKNFELQLEEYNGE